MNEKPNMLDYGLNSSKVAYINRVYEFEADKRNRYVNIAWWVLIVAVFVLFLVLDDISFHSKGIAQWSMSLLLFSFACYIPAMVLFNFIHKPIIASLVKKDKIDYLKHGGFTEKTFDLLLSSRAKFNSANDEYELAMQKATLDHYVQTLDSIVDELKYKRNIHFISEKQNAFELALNELKNTVKSVRLSTKSYKERIFDYQLRSKWIESKRLKALEDEPLAKTESVVGLDRPVTQIKPSDITDLQFQITKVEDNFSNDEGKTNTNRITTPRKIDYATNNAKNTELGLRGEEFVLAEEKNKLLALNKNDLAKKVHHVSKIDGDGLGYDIVSYKESGEKIFIEVKTTSEGVLTPFYLSDKENYMMLNTENYFIYRVYNFNATFRKGSIFKIDKPEKLTNYFDIRPTSYLVTPKPRKSKYKTIDQIDL